MKQLIYKYNKNVIYKRLQYYRNMQKLTQSQLAAKLQVMNVNIDQQMISKIENNARIVTDYELASLCIILKIDVSNLLADFYNDLYFK